MYNLPRSVTRAIIEIQKAVRLPLAADRNESDANAHETKVLCL